MTTPAEIIAAVQSHGSDAQDLRDAAHEACHAIDAKLRGLWERERIHRALSRKYGNRGSLVFAEVRARAVEQIVCTDLGVDCGTVERWAHVTFLETLKNMQILLPSAEWFVDCVKRDMERTGARLAADAVLALKPKRRRSR